MGAWLHSIIPEIIILSAAGGILAALILKLVRRARDRRRLSDEAERRLHVEKQFREAELQLDELLDRDKAVITARGITITDWSARTYHYKNETLSWRYQFETRHRRGSEVEKVWVEVSLQEDDPASLKVSRCAELFQIGKQSRWNSRAEAALPLEEAVQRGLSSIVLGAIREGEAAVAATA